MGFRTGYVGIPKGHKLYRKHYDDINVSCHGGLTYSNDKLVDQIDDDIWWIGFGCGHYRDGYDYDKAIELFKDYPEMVNSIERYKENSIFEDSFYWIPKSLEFCEEECKDIVNQITRYGYAKDNLE